MSALLVQKPLGCVRIKDCVEENDKKIENEKVDRSIGSNLIFFLPKSFIQIHPPPEFEEIHLIG